jgi:hypothetical protein
LTGSRVSVSMSGALLVAGAAVSARQMVSGVAGSVGITPSSDAPAVKPWVVNTKALTRP